MVGFFATSVLKRGKDLLLILMISNNRTQKGSLFFRIVRAFLIEEQKIVVKLMKSQAPKAKPVKAQAPAK